MLRQLLLATLIFVSAGCSLQSQASAKAKAPVQQQGKTNLQSDDRWTHWPWRLAQPIPWSDIQGIWKVEDGDYVSYFTFRKIYRAGSDVRQISVRQIDPSGCQVVARGVGIEKGSFIYSQMTSEDGGIYRLNLSVFKCADSPLSTMEQQKCSDSMVVLSMGELSAQNLDQMIHMRIMKVSSDLTQNVCLNKKSADF
jgi:hypothetical protein